MTSNYSLFLDDERYPPESSKANWVICRSVEEAMEVIEKMPFPDFISFDHDLGDPLTGYDFAKWLVHKDMVNELVFPGHGSFPYTVHSQNQPGKANIESYLDGYAYFVQSGG